MCIKPESRHLTAFITPWGFYEWVRVPFGLMNAPAVFQRFMEQCFQDYRDQFIVPYLDDLLVFSKNFDDHLKHLELTLQRLRKYGVKLKTRKCQLFRREVRYLGRIVSAERYRLDPKNIEAVTSMLKQKPKNLGDVRRMLGMVGYFRKYIPNFSVKAEPLYQLLKKTDNSYSSKSIISWEENHQNALDSLLVSLIEPPILAYPDYNQEFILHVDASGKGLGAVLLQYQEDELRVIGYGSRSLTPAEKKYHSSKLEFLGVKWAVCSQFRDYLYYAPHFHIYTDNNPVTYINTRGRLTATGQRWVNELAEF